ncbi:Na(+)/H(+) antiporter subunit F1 [Oceanobacillus polygoni]|uniref:Multicomponent Na+:H+ antiporter subunit F n=1 Tax=Oceanobacillus polygoni TaxID=1235259 RepID=A0A9X1CI32_9BACI|nr:Na(+)/H(+) antiporter subunit F1 [Oceanobacillus polygoni]MBP2078117.1 multicomponent Na+:H+ antiporter subunit F [Oceanobacillus polygoni]
MFQIILYFSLLVLAISLVLFLIRIIKGPSTQDRILGLDCIGVTLVGFIGIIMILQETIAYSDIILVLSILAFVGTVAMSKFMERGAVFDRD